MGTWKAFRKFGSADRRAVMAAAAVIAASRVALRTVGYRRWTSVLSKVFARRVRLAADKITPEPRVRFLSEHLVRLNGAAARNLPFKPTCLERSIGLWWLLRRHGLSAELRIGGRKIGERFEAHAWVEQAGVVLADPGGEHHGFSVFGSSGSVAARSLR